MAAPLLLSRSDSILNVLALAPKASGYSGQVIGFGLIELDSAFGVPQEYRVVAGPASDGPYIQQSNCNLRCMHLCAST